MNVFKLSPLLLLILTAAADKKIELEDIEEDNLKSEKEAQQNEQLRKSANTASPNRISQDYVKYDMFKNFYKPLSQLTPQQRQYLQKQIEPLVSLQYMQRYAAEPRVVQQYAVTEQPETYSKESAPESRPEPSTHEAQQGPSAPDIRLEASAPSEPSAPEFGPGLNLPWPRSAQHGLIGYLSNMPMQVYLVPQADKGERTAEAAQYAASAPGANQVEAPAIVQDNNYIETPAFLPQVGQAYVHQYPTAPIAYVPYAPQSYAHPSYAPTTYAPHIYASPTYGPPSQTHQSNLVPVLATVSPTVAYQVMVPPKGYLQYYTRNNNNIDETEELAENPKAYQIQQTEPTYEYTKPVHEYPKYYYSSRPPTKEDERHGALSESSTTSEHPRYYSSRAPIREDQRHGAVSELPPPNPVLLTHPPPHLAHLPKALPMYRPLSKPVYASGTHHFSSFTPRPNELHSYSSKRKPSSLLDSYIPSGVQLDYMRKGYTKDPLQAYEDLLKNRHYKNYPVPRHYERGFLPNQMYHTAAGGITYGHYKRNTKNETGRKK